MIKIENTEIVGWEAAIRGMRNPMNSWEKSDSCFGKDPCRCDYCDHLTWECYPRKFNIGPNDYDLMMRLAKGGSVHAKYRRMIVVYADITAPLYWWKEFDTYKVGTVANSCSTLHKIHEKEFTMEDFSCEHLKTPAILALNSVIDELNRNRYNFVNFDELGYVDEIYTPERKKQIKKDIWWQMIQLLPSSYNQRRTVMLNYEVLAGIYTWRKDHKLDEWRVHETPIEHHNHNKDFSSGMWGFCDWIESLPYSEIITAKPEEEKEVLDTHTMDKIQMLLRDAGYSQASIAVENMKNNFQSITKIKESEG